MADDVLDIRPFSPLRWDGYSWAGETLLPSWAGFQSRRGGYSSVDSGKPSIGTASLAVTSEGGDEETKPIPEQVRAFQYLMEHEAAVAAAVGRAIVEYYPEARRMDAESLYSDNSTPL